MPIWPAFCSFHGNHAPNFLMFMLYINRYILVFVQVHEYILLTWALVHQHVCYYLYGKVYDVYLHPTCYCMLIFPCISGLPEYLRAFCTYTYQLDTSDRWSTQKLPPKQKSAFVVFVVHANRLWVNSLCDNATETLISCK